MIVRGVHLVLLTLLLLLALSADIGKAVDCTGLPNNAFLGERLSTLLAAAAGEADGPVVTIDQVHYTCQVQGTTMGAYQQLSVALRYSTDADATLVIRQYELICQAAGWSQVAGSLSPVNELSAAGDFTVYTALGTSTGCSSCNENAGNNNHCIACDAACTAGLMRCTGATAADCCAAFEADGACSPDTTCDTPNFVANEDNNFVCTCGSCGAGQTLDAVTCTCNITDICLANEPCENGGTCTVGADPGTNYSCDCSGTNFMGDNCSLCIVTCGLGESKDAASCTCSITNLCEADNPCENGGTCTSGANPATNYTCDCAGTNYFGDTCSECGLVCNGSYLPNDNCDQCVLLTDICESTSPCQNGGTCMLASPTDQQQYRCTCTEYYTGENCTDCELQCLNGGTVDENCRSCDCATGYTSGNCTMCDTGYTSSRDGSCARTDSGSSFPWWMIIVIVLIVLLAVIGGGSIVGVIVAGCLIHKKKRKGAGSEEEEMK